MQTETESFWKFFSSVSDFNNLKRFGFMVLVPKNVGSHEKDWNETK